MTGLQGFIRAHKLYLVGTYKSNHEIKVSIAYDFEEEIAQSVTIVPLQDSDPAYETKTLEQFQISLERQKCKSIQVTIEDLSGSGEGVTLESLGITIGAKLSYPKLPPDHKVT